MAGISQFLDIGTGRPTANNIHEFAQAVAPGSRIVYVDKTRWCWSTLKRCWWTSEGATDYIEADLHDPDKIMQGRREPWT